MENLMHEEEVIYYDLLINFFMNNPAFYDKMYEHYAYTVEKMDKLQKLSDYLKELNIEKKVPEIVHTWQNLVKQFKKHLTDEKNARSGSGAKESNFRYYENLLFLKPALEHRQVLSSISLSSKPALSPNCTLDCDANTLKTSSVSSFPAMPLSNTSSHSNANSNVILHRKSVAGSSFTPRRTLNVPEYDQFAHKKMKFMTETDENINIIGKKIIQTLDCVNKKVLGAKETRNTMNTTANTTTRVEDVSAIDYKSHLTAALNGIPPECENECMKYIIQQLEIFDQQQDAQKKN